MRRRLVLSTLTAVLLAVFLLGVPLAVAGDLLLADQSRHDVDQRARSLALFVDHRVQGNEPITNLMLQDDLGTSLRGHEQEAVVQSPAGTWRVGPVISGSAYVGQYSTSNGVVVTVSIRRGDVHGDMVKASAIVVGLSIIAVGAAVALGLFQAKRLSAPLVQLAENAERLGAGEARLGHVDSGVVEVDRVAAVLNRSARRMAATLAAERDFASDASHQLRTPLTALSMRLEEIADSETVTEAREEAQIALEQVERLTQTVQDLLARSRQAHHDSTELISLDEVVEQQQREWSSAFEAVGRSLRVSGARGLLVEATPAGLAQVLSTLLDNSLVHGDGTAWLTTRSAGGSVVIEVGDDGPGVPPELGQRIFARSVSGAGSTGLGLGLARDLAAADGGRVELLRGSPPVFGVFLSAGREPAGRP